MKQSQYSEVFRIIPQHTRTFPHVARPNREVHASVCCAFHTLEAARAVPLPSPWHRNSWLDSRRWTSWLHTPFGQDSHSYKTICSLTAASSVGWPNLPWTVTGQSCSFRCAPPPSNTQIWLPQLCPGLWRHLAPTLSYTWCGCAEESLPALKGLLSFALAVEYSLTSLSSLRELITPQTPEDLLRIQKDLKEYSIIWIIVCTHTHMLRARNKE